MKNPKGKIQKIGAGIFLLLSSAASAVFGLYIGMIVDAVYEGDASLFVKRLIIAASVILLNAFFSMMGWSCVYSDCCRSALVLKEKIYLRELNKPRAENVDMANFSSKVDLLYNDDYMNRWLIYSNILLFIFSCVAIISINWIMLLVALAVSLIPMLVPGFFNKYVQKAADNFSKESSRYMAHVNDTLQGRLEIIKYGVMQTFCINHAKKNTMFEHVRYKSRTANRNAMLVTETVGNIAIMSIFLIGGVLTFRGLIGIGGVIGVIQLMNNVVNPVVQIAGYKNELNACKPILNELNANPVILQSADQSLDIKSSDDVIITASNITYKYAPDDKLILNQFNHQFKNARKYLICGESGSGKSTLAKLLAGELKPVSGKIKINGTDIQSLSSDKLFQLISYVDQKTYVFNDSIMNNILMYRDIEKNKLSPIIDGLGIQELDMEKQVDDDNGISGGQKSRVCIARAATALPRVLIIDEPTAALDSENSWKVMNYLVSLPITVIVISHNLDEKITSLFQEVIAI